eukprot:m.99043 g.99043  ORF g.99043 m.99043 type:complete len:302 (-) comp10293_c0_seq2:129-1034(-)
MPGCRHDSHLLSERSCCHLHVIGGRPFCTKHQSVDRCRMGARRIHDRVGVNDIAGTSTGTIATQSQPCDASTGHGNGCHGLAKEERGVARGFSRALHVFYGKFGVGHVPRLGEQHAAGDGLLSAGRPKQWVLQHPRGSHDIHLHTECRRGTIAPIQFMAVQGGKWNTHVATERRGRVEKGPCGVVFKHQHARLAERCVGAAVAAGRKRTDKIAPRFPVVVAFPRKLHALLNCVRLAKAPAGIRRRSLPGAVQTVNHTHGPSGPRQCHCNGGSNDPGANNGYINHQRLGHGAARVDSGTTWT